MHLRPEPPSSLEAPPAARGRAPWPPGGPLKAVPSSASTAEADRSGPAALHAIGVPRLRLALLLFFLWVLLRNAWLSEDSFITFRVADNFIHGYGLRWNPLERVQVYTHPLWLLLVSAVYFVTRDVYFAASVLSVVCSGLAVWLVLRTLTTPAQLLVAGVLFTFSKAFVDFSTGGLENALSHLLLALFFVEYLKPADARSLKKMIWFAGIALLNRMDLVWMLSPAIVHVAWTRGAWRPRAWSAWVGLLPFALWEVFSLVYYGFLLPNSAYTKLFTGLGFIALLGQGGCYFLNSLAWDPITLFAIAALLCVAFRGAKHDRPALMLAIGVLLQLAYVAKIGGDYMSGRFFAEPFLVSVLLLSRCEFESPWESVVVVGLLLALGYGSPRPPIQTNEQYVGLGSSPQSVDDERGYRHNDTSLLRLNKDHTLKETGGWIADGVKARREHTRVTEYKNIGYYGFFAGPGVHIIDPYGLGDPLLARLPFSGGSWAAGHFLRTIPAGYREAVVDDGEIADPEIAAYWKKLKLVTRGPLFDGARLREVVRFNLGMNPAPR
jgi:arabinofuranosyltransferase